MCAPEDIWIAMWAGVAIGMAALFLILVAFEK